MLSWRNFSVFPALSPLVILTGCGFSTPSFHEFYDSEESATLVQAIQEHAHCELRDAVQFLVLDDQDAAIEKAKLTGTPVAEPRLDWLKTWGAQVTLVMTVDEKTSLNPGATLTPPVPPASVAFGANKVSSVAQSGSIGLSGTGSVDATRKQTLSWLVKFKDWTDDSSLAQARKRRDALYAEALAARSNTVASTCANRIGPFVEGDLQFRDWLYTSLLPAAVKGGVGGDFPQELAAEAAASKKDVLQDDITFVVLYGGSINPAWKLLRVSANQASPSLFGVQRTRTEDLLVTMGPLAPDGTLSTATQNQALASLIGIAVANAIRNTQ